jgi:hypothetical protein
MPLSSSKNAKFTVKFFAKNLEHEFLFVSLQSNLINRLQS